MSAIEQEFYAAKASSDPDRFIKACEAAKAAGYLIIDGGYLSATAKVKDEPQAEPDVPARRFRVRKAEDEA